MRRSPLIQREKISIHAPHFLTPVSSEPWNQASRRQNGDHAKAGDIMVDPVGFVYILDRFEKKRLEDGWLLVDQRAMAEAIEGIATKRGLYMTARIIRGRYEL